MANEQNLTHNGRPKGSKNKFTLVKEQIVNCFSVTEMQEWKKTHYSEFFKGVISLLPKELQVDLLGEISINKETLEILEKKLTENKK